jgi:hypothetical protein
MDERAGRLRPAFFVTRCLPLRMGLIGGVCPAQTALSDRGRAYEPGK